MGTPGLGSPAMGPWARGQDLASLPRRWEKSAVRGRSRQRSPRTERVKPDEIAIPRGFPGCRVAPRSRTPRTLRTIQFPAVASPDLGLVGPQRREGGIAEGWGPRPLIPWSDRGLGFEPGQPWAGRTESSHPPALRFCCLF